MAAQVSTVGSLSWLADLGLSSDGENFGTFDGKKWFGNGAVVEATTPITGEHIGKIRGSTLDDYESCQVSTVL